MFSQDRALIAYASLNQVNSSYAVWQGGYRRSIALQFSVYKNQLAFNRFRYLKIRELKICRSSFGLHTHAGNWRDVGVLPLLVFDRGKAKLRKPLHSGAA